MPSESTLVEELDGVDPVALHERQGAMEEVHCAQILLGNTSKIRQTCFSNKKTAGRRF